jgi:hypothetical protein
MDFNQEQLDMMYDEAMAWQPNPMGMQPGADNPQAVLQTLLARNQQPANTNQGEQIAQ